MDESLLEVDVEPLSSSSSSLAKRWEVLVMGEMKKVSYIAMPMVVTTVSQYMLRVISMMMIGHLGELSLSGASIATSLTNVTGFSLLFGMSSALETLCGQAYGAERYQMLGIYTYGAIISLLLVCIPISVLWIFTERLLILIGQDPLISHEAGNYSIWLIPTLFPYAILQLLIRFLLAQSLIYPMLLSSVAALVFHIPISWLLVFKFKIGSAGAALGIGLSYWLNVVLLGIYVKYASSCEKTRISFSQHVFPSIREFFRLGIPSAIMICCRSVLGYAFGEEKELVDYVKDMVPLLSLSVLMDCLAALFSGVARGVGWQHLGAYVNLGAFFLCGIPMACVLAFVFHWRGKGLWTGLTTASLLQGLMLMMITFFTNWKKQARAARQRTIEGRSQLTIE
ncbi:protein DETOXIFICATION 3 isoform X3 [Daucus carota subsp. sativus]|uniref:protein DETOXIFICATION 3 isoform X3 n=1 Tax=Daucus carota subsp. sativus TaxID=79200 RepID=UPI003083EDBD